MGGRGLNDAAIEIERAALRLLAGRDYSRAELRRRLVADGHAGEQLDSVLEELNRQGLQSDERFTEHFVARRQSRGQGPRRIRAELRQRGVPTETVDAWVDEADDAWRELMRRVLTERFGTKPPADRREQGQRARFLEYRGFPQDLIRRELFD